MLTQSDSGHLSKNPKATLHRLGPCFFMIARTIKFYYCCVLRGGNLHIAICIYPTRLSSTQKTSLTHLPKYQNPFLSDRCDEIPTQLYTCYIHTFRMSRLCTERQEFLISTSSLKPLRPDISYISVFFLAKCIIYDRQDHGFCILQVFLATYESIFLQINQFVNWF